MFFIKDNILLNNIDHKHICKMVPNIVFGHCIHIEHIYKKVFNVVLVQYPRLSLSGYGQENATNWLWLEKYRGC